MKLKLHFELRFNRIKACLMKKNGFTLLEVVLAIFILSMSAFGAFSLIQSTVISASLSKQKLTAYYLAQESLEVVRNIRDNNWLEQREDSGVLWTDGILTGGSCMNPRPTVCDSYGDINRDGVVTAADTDLMPSLISGLGDKDQRKRADVDGNGTISVSDTNAMTSFIFCNIDTFPACSAKAEFQKEITATQLSADLLEVSVKIIWGERGRSHEVEVISQLSDWK